MDVNDFCEILWKQWLKWFQCMVSQLHFAVIVNAMITQTPKAKAATWMHTALIISRLETDIDYVINLWRLNWHWREIRNMLSTRFSVSMRWNRYQVFFAVKSFEASDFLTSSTSCLEVSWKHFDLMWRVHQLSFPITLQSTVLFLVPTPKHIWERGHTC